MKPGKAHSVAGDVKSVVKLGAQVCVLLSSFCWMPQASAQTTWGSPFGSNLQLWTKDPQEPAAVTEQMMDMAENAGIRWNRDGFTWHVLEKSPGVWDFSSTDSAVAICEDHGIKMIGVLGFGHKGYGYTSEFKGPQTQTQIDAFKNYVFKVVERYKGRVDHWEFWNEPDLDAFLDADNNSAEYARILRIAAPEIKRANPNATIMGPATAAEPIWTIQDMIADGSVNLLDAISFHTYSTPASLEATSDVRLTDLRNILANHGITKPLIVTEAGFPTHVGSLGVSMERQAELMVRGYALLLSHGVKVVAGYCFRNMITENGAQWTSIDRNWGWVWKDLTPKPAFTAMRTMSNMLASRSYLKKLPVTVTSGELPRIKALAFTNSAGRETVVIWSYEELYDNKQLLRSMSYPVTITGFVKDTTTVERDRLYDLQGFEQPLTSVSGGYTFNVGPTPIYLTGRDLNNANIVVQQMTKPAPVEVIVDNLSPNTSSSGVWTTSTYGEFYGGNVVHDSNTDKTNKWFRFTPDLPVTGEYDVYMQWSSHLNRAKDIEVEIVSAEGSTIVPISQAGGGGVWALLGRYRFDAGNTGFVKIHCAGTTGYVVADAVRFIKPLAGVLAPPSVGTIPAEADTYVIDGSAGSNYGTSSTLAVKDATEAGYDRIAYLRFPLSGMGGPTASATLKLTVSSVGAEGTGPKTIELRQLADDGWGESTVTWNNKPSAAGTLIATFAPTVAGEVWSLDVTTWVNSQLGDGEASFVLVQPGAANRLVNFYSREDATRKPVIEFE